MLGIIAQAQDRTIIHLKNGTKKTYYNCNFVVRDLQEDNLKWRLTNVRPDDEGFCDIDFSNYSIMNCYGSILSTMQKNYYGELTTDKYYDWQTNYNKVYFCLDTIHNPTIDQCELSAEVTDIVSDKGLLGKYIHIGSKDKSWYGKQYDSETIYYYSAIPGKTYYYRLARKVDYLENGVNKSVCVYGDEGSFKVPLLMKDSGLIPAEFCGRSNVYPDSIAWKLFIEKHFKGMNLNGDRFAKRWFQWIYQNMDLVTITNVFEFDDGTLSLVSSIPDEFYKWMIENSEIVINDINQIFSIDNGVFYQVEADSLWGIENDSYMCISPEKSTSNPTIYFDMSQSIPCIKYQLRITFVPSQNNNEKPSKIKISATLLSEEGKLIEERIYNEDGKTDHIIEATSVSQKIFNDITNIERLKIACSVSIRETAKYNREIRIAEIRLTPMEKDNPQELH